MAKVNLGARVLFGLIFFVFGANGLVMQFNNGVGFIPMPPPPPEMAELMACFMRLSYLMPLVKILETLGGALLLVGIYQRLALVLLTPIVVNIAGLHFFVDTSGAPMAAILLVLNAVLLRAHWQGGFSALLKK